MTKEEFKEIKDQLEKCLTDWGFYSCAAMDGDPNSAHGIELSAKCKEAKSKKEFLLEKLESEIVK